MRFRCAESVVGLQHERPDMRKKGKYREHGRLHAVPRADWLPPESNSNKYYSQLLLTRTEGGSGPLCLVGRELQLVWYATERDRIQDRHGRLVCVLEFKDCWKRREESGDRYYFTAMLLEDLSGEYREWLGHQEHRGRPFGEDAEVLETEVRFSVAVQGTKERRLGMEAPATQPFLIHQPELHELSSPQLDMIFDVMSFLYQSIPGMELMAELRARATPSARPKTASDRPLELELSGCAMP
jgi:hypothetical protein